MSATVRISAQTHVKLKALAECTGESMPAILERAVETYRRQQLLDETNRGYAALRSDPEAWQAELEEREAWEASLLDGLENDPYEGEAVSDASAAAG